jgi:hypothetical protein
MTEEVDDWGLDYEMDYHDNLNLDRLQSGYDEPKLTRGFSFNLMEEKEIESKQ